ncbi:MAG TPA: abortive infection family protein [Paludibaculum sp.]
MLPELTTNTITPVTRKEITDFLSWSCDWAGNLNEHDFLGRLYDLSKLPSTDRRPEYRANASADIYQHRVNNADWGGKEWLFADGRFNIRHCPDDEFLTFLCETVHPMVRSNAEEIRNIVAFYNEQLAVDGWELAPAKFISSRPVFSYRQISDGAGLHLEQAKAVAERLSGQYVVQQIRRLEEAVEKDPELAIGTAKEFLETLCKTILNERGVAFAKDEDLPALVKATIKALKIIPDNLAKSGSTEKTITVLLNNLSSIGRQLAELRNLYGTGHGKLTHHVGLEKRHARLAVGAAATLALFLFDSHEAEGNSEQSQPAKAVKDEIQF